MRNPLRHVLFLGCGFCLLALPIQKVSAEALPSSVAAQEVNRILLEEMGSEVATSGPIDDVAFLRRAMLDLNGQLPTPSEISIFTLDPNPSEVKRSAVVRSLMSRDTYARNWARYWRDVIFYRRTSERAQISLPSSEFYLTDQFQENRPWDEIATDLITATGEVRSHGETALIMAHMDDTENLASEVSRIFLGIQISCAQCHDHPYDRWQREQFHELAAFFPRVKVRQVRDQFPPTFEVVSHDYLPRYAQFRPEAADNPRLRIEHRMSDLERPEERGQVMQPALFITDQQYGTGERDIDRRLTLSKWITSKNNPWFSKAYVNRIWTVLVGESFYDSVDDIGPDRGAHAENTLKFLSDQFAENDYDIKWLFETIMQTEIYQSAGINPDRTQTIAYQGNACQPLRSDQLFSSLLQVLGMPEPPVLPPPPPSGAPSSRRNQFNPGFQFMQTFGFDPSMSAQEWTLAIPQALALMNSPYLMRSLNGYNFSTPLGQLLREKSENDEVVYELYLRTLAREPTAGELQVCREYVQEVNNRVEAFEDIQWTLLNSTEFLHRR
ncbi:Cytochrome c domain-containing protein [Planctomycetales bacterium 10988]|nr:Cytochrome c domain-containing protein [Planctomycetales bacterium 10988]